MKGDGFEGLCLKEIQSQVGPLVKENLITLHKYSTKCRV